MERKKNGSEKAVVIIIQLAEPMKGGIMSVIRVKELEKKYPKRKNGIFRDLSFTVEREIV